MKIIHITKTLIDWNKNIELLKTGMTDELIHASAMQ